MFLDFLTLNVPFQLFAPIRYVLLFSDDPKIYTFVKSDQFFLGMISQYEHK